jgi:DNA-binding transcriptional regulator YdaS (Cro superfamily)
MTALDKAVGVCGGVAALASAIGVASSAPSMWKARGRVPAQHCPAIERVTRERHAEDQSREIVRCEDLCPDVEWHVLRLQSCEPATAVAGEGA